MNILGNIKSTHTISGTHYNENACTGSFCVRSKMSELCLGQYMHTQRHNKYISMRTQM